MHLALRLCVGKRSVARKAVVTRGAAAAEGDWDKSVPLSAGLVRAWGAFSSSACHRMEEISKRQHCSVLVW
eukprot:CAMPEP_0119355708 /NCGR_PEP_ID=MMETSP1334-20130426/4501_1 /TAXON_ID=127549 /ORGANISM="Calcidiscus leptoporus, Strain RCC1130" /LENGTH=70 /DNA_ID=CAMNT_0007369601 /DNA_START=422 /DNA_END=631 /DNA_ORIENTATION=+